MRLKHWKMFIILVLICLGLLLLRWAAIAFG
ncbi:small membrane protein YniD [Gibbsiella quercinecans]